MSTKSAISSCGIEEEYYEILVKSLGKKEYFLKAEHKLNANTKVLKLK
jgi:hypothetical protein